MSDITKANEVWVGTSKNADYVSGVEEEGFVRFIRADTAIPRADLDAMVAAAYEDAAERAGRESALIYESEVRPDADNNVYRTVCEVVLSALPANARAALDTIVREAVTKERERVVAKFDAFSDTLICAITAQFIRDLGADIRAGEDT